MVKMRVKGLLFDSPKVVRAVDSATRWALSRAGAFIRTRAKTSIRKRKKISAPGKPPSSHEGTLRRLIFFGYEPAGRTVVIGPVAHGKGEAPSLLELGGTVNRTVIRRRHGKYRAKKQRMTYKPRPFMGPAMVKELPNLPKRWQGSVRST